jgi:hypothetical protein
VGEPGPTNALDDPCLVLGDVAVLLADGGAPGPALQALQAGLGLAAARSAVLAIAGDLPPGVRAEWLARPDITALLEA